MKYTINELANSKGVSQPVREALLQMEAELVAIKQALAAPVQEPLEYWNAVEGWVKIDEVREHFDSVGCGTIYKTAGDGRVPLTAAQRQWTGLTDEEIDGLKHMIDWTGSWSYTAFAHAIAHLLKIKNT